MLRKSKGDKIEGQDTTTTGKGKSEIIDRDLEKDNTGDCEGICICTHASLIQIFKNDVLIKYLWEYSSESMSIIILLHFGVIHSIFN